MILVFGATGKTGKEIIKQLLALKVPIRVLIRDHSKASYFQNQGIDVVIGDANNVNDVTLALKQVEKVYIVVANGKNQGSQEKLITDCAVQAKVKLLVKQSSLETTIYPNNPIPKSHLESEQYIKQSGLNWVIIRPTFFNQMLLMCAHHIKIHNTLHFPMSNGCVVATDVRDVAEVAAKVLTGSGHINKIYNICGSELLSFNAIADLFSKVLKRKITYINYPINDYKEMLETRLDDKWRVDAVCKELQSLSACSVNYAQSNDVPELLGREPITLEQFIEDHKDAFNKE